MSVHVMIREEAVDKCAKAIAEVHNQDWKSLPLSLSKC